MDRRTLLYILAFSLLFFGLNLYFENQNVQKTQVWMEQQKKKKVQQEEKLRQEVVQKTVKSDQLPVTNLYSDQEEKHLITSGIFVDDQIIVPTWTETLPQTIYAKSKKFTLAFGEKASSSPALYQSSSGKRLKITELPNSGFFDLQLVSIDPKNPQMPEEVTLGQFADGHFSVPLNLYPKSNAIALFKTADGYVPVGYYIASDQTLHAFSSDSQWKPFLEVKETKPTTNGKEEKFYVLEDEYQQLVFSNYGGSLAEINLPFKTETNTKSIVREVEADRQMVKDHPYNAYFPAHPYFTPGSSPVLHEKGALGGYYPLMRRDLIESGKYKSVKIEPRFYALNLISEYPETAQLIYEVTHFDEKSIVFEARQYHRHITKTYSFEESVDAPYCLNLEIKIDGDAKGLWLTSGVPEVEWISGGAAPVLKYRITRNDKPSVENIDLPKDAVTVSSVSPDWVCNSNGFFGMIQDPITETESGYRIQKVDGSLVPSRLTEIDQEYNRYKASDLPGYMTMLPLKPSGGSMTFRLFAGPFEDDLLKQIDSFYSNADTGYNPDYVACQTMHGWFTFISQPFAQFLMILMKFFHYLTGSWGFSIILLTVALRIMMYPLNNWSTKSMARMQLVAPQITAIQEKYKKDPKQAQIEIMNLYREKKINPASGCLPLLIQMPFLIGMFDLLKSSFVLRGAPFVPGWINDLTAPDVLFSWHYPIFFIGTEFHLLPILLAFVMFAQQRFFSAAPTDVSQMTDQQRQQKAMGNIMTLVFAVMFYHFPSGLNIYWLSSMLLGMWQQRQITNKLKKSTL